MGDVWRAEDLVLALPVALKVLHRVGLHARTSILNEVRLARQITHPAICRVYDVGESGGRVFYTMELVEGDDLAALLHRAPRLPSETVRNIALQLCAGLAAAHSQNVLHRDLKPANVLMDTGGRVRITDFGIAVVGDRSDRSLPAGTPGYMAPEQLVPGAPLSPQTDLYSLGLMLYEMVAGRRPFDDLEARGEPPPLASLRSDVDPALADVIHWALALEPARRPPSADVMANRLRGGRERRRAARVATVTTRPADRRVVFAAAAAIAVVAALVVWWFRGSSLSPGLTGRDTIVLADFENSTGEAVFDGTLRVGLAVALEQSPFIKIFPEEQVADALRLMKQPPGARVTRALARDVARREGLKAFLAGSIVPLGSDYVIALEAVNAESGDVMARTQVQAASREDVLTQLGQAAAALRERLGESLASIRRFDVPLPQATTSSLDALHAYAMALDEGRVRVRLDSIPPLRRAIELDPEFALAHAMLSGAYANTDQPGIAPEYAKRAFDLRNRVSERERFFIGWRYYRDATFAADKALELTRSWTETYPRESIAFNSLGLARVYIGQYETGIEAFREAQRLDPKFFAPYGNIAEAALAINRLDEAEASLRLADERGINVTLVRRVSFLLAMMRNDEEGMARQLVTAQGVAESNAPSWRARAAVALGRISTAHEEFARAIAMARDRMLDESAAQFMAEDAEAHAAVGQCDDARNEGERALAISRDNFTLQRLSRTYALCGNQPMVQELLGELRRRFPEATLTHRVLAPMAEAVVALGERNSSEAIRLLSVITPYERASIGELWPWYLAGAAQLQSGHSAQAAVEFRKVIDQRGIRPTSVAIPLARLGLARAAAAGGDVAKARALYDELLFPLGDETALPVVREARIERSRLN